MTNFELENRLIRLSSDLSAKACEIAAIRCQLAGRPESYMDDALIEADKCIAAMQFYGQRACLALGSATGIPGDMADPDVEHGMTPLVGIV